MINVFFLNNKEKMLHCKSFKRHMFKHLVRNMIKNDQNYMINIQNIRSIKRVRKNEALNMKYYIYFKEKILSVICES